MARHLHQVWDARSLVVLTSGLGFVLGLGLYGFRIVGFGFQGLGFRMLSGAQLC